MNDVTTIEALTIGVYQLSLISNKDIIGVITYNILVMKDGKEEVKQVFEDRDIALGIFEGTKNYYRTLAEES